MIIISLNKYIIYNYTILNDSMNKVTFPRITLSIHIKK